MKEVKGLLEENMEMPQSIKAKVTRAKLAPIDQLCEEGLIPSSEILANICPALVASIEAQGINE